MPVVCRFTFQDAPDREAIETQLALAIVATECVFGQPKVRVSAAYSISPASQPMDGERTVHVVIDVSTPVGEHIAEVFTGLMIRQLGEDQFTVERVDRADRKNTTEGAAGR